MNHKVRDSMDDLLFAVVEAKMLMLHVDTSCQRLIHGCHISCLCNIFAVKQSANKDYLACTVYSHNWTHSTACGSTYSSYLSLISSILLRFLSSHLSWAYGSDSHRILSPSIGIVLVCPHIQLTAVFKLGIFWLWLAFLIRLSQGMNFGTI